MKVPSSNLRWPPSAVLGVLVPLLALPILAAPLCPAQPAPDSGSGQNTARPNILWITCEDMSPNLGCYGDPYAITPNLDRFAQGGVRYTRAFATAPVCSPARSCLITGLYATSLGTQNLRSTFPIPEEIKGFPSYLRAAGYYCSNNEKTDYNTSSERAIIAASWDESSARAHWRKRRPGQPFFSVFNIMVTHQSRTSAWPYEQFERMIEKVLKPQERHDPAKASVPPWYPDTPVVRRSLARYHDCITAMDKEAGKILEDLSKDGLAEETIVLFYGDHGMGMPRGKRTLYDSGLRVPLIARFPERFKHLAPTPPGQTVDRLVSFVDFAPTVLSLAGATIPPYMQGVPFLGPAAGPPRRCVYGARDRVDEAFDLARSVRDARYLYIRNYRPHLSWNQPEGYSDTAELRQEITRLAAAGRLNANQLAYAGPSRPPEELYDSESDPHQVRNLASSPQHEAVLERMRGLHEEWELETLDLGFLPEADAWARCAGFTPWRMARDAGRFPLKDILHAASLVGRRDALRRQADLLSNADAGVRYWAAVGLSAAGKDAAPAEKELSKCLEDPSQSVRIEAAGAMAALGGAERALPVLVRELGGAQLDSALHAARTLQLLGEKARPALPALKAALEAASSPEAKAAQHLFLEFSLEATIAGLQR